MLQSQRHLQQLHHISTRRCADTYSVSYKILSYPYVFSKFSPISWEFLKRNFIGMLHVQLPTRTCPSATGNKPHTAACYFTNVTCRYHPFSHAIFATSWTTLSLPFSRDTAWVINWKNISQSIKESQSMTTVTDFTLHSLRFIFPLQFLLSENIWCPKNRCRPNWLLTLPLSHCTISICAISPVPHTSSYYSNRGRLPVCLNVHSTAKPFHY